MREALTSWLAEQLGSAVEIADLGRIATGNSRAMWRLNLVDGSRFVVRVEQGGVFGTSGAEEFRLMQAAHRLGCPVARVRWTEPTGAVVGQPFFVMDYLDGAATGRDDRSLSPALATDLVVQLDRLHHTDWAAHLDAGGADGVAATHLQVDRWHEVARDAVDETSPLIEEAAAWLHRHAPQPRLVGIVHGDPGPGNMVHDGERVIAFTDWEFAHLGDPAEDWAYLIGMRGAKTMSPAEWRTLFRTAAGVELSDDEFRYWAVFNFFKGACANLTCRRVFLTNNPAPNMAMIGTALHQTYLRNAAELIGAT